MYANFRFNYNVSGYWNKIIEAKRAAKKITSQTKCNINFANLFLVFFFFIRAACKVPVLSTESIYK